MLWTLRSSDLVLGCETGASGGGSGPWRWYLLLPSCVNEDFVLVGWSRTRVVKWK